MTQGQVVQCRFYTPGLQTGARYVVTDTGIEKSQPVVCVRPLDDAGAFWHRDNATARYWAWRFAPYLGREQ